MYEIRRAEHADLEAMHRIRLAVRENRLTRSVLSLDDYRRETTETGRGWVAEEAGEILGFAVANGESGNLWALFVHPDHEGRRIGRGLHDAAVDWLRERGLETLWLRTDPGTRAEAFYRAGGWRADGLNEHGEIRFELDLG